jgi:hypothetical protein
VVVISRVGLQIAKEGEREKEYTQKEIEDEISN